MTLSRRGNYGNVRRKVSSLCLLGRRLKQKRGGDTARIKDTMLQDGIS